MPTYFTPSEGIAREVIQADLCRYLGNDATMRVGEHNGTPGYFITAFRPFTANMLADLKADSLRWQEEARSSRVQGYTQSQVHQSRQYWGPTDNQSSTPSTASTQGYRQGVSTPSSSTSSYSTSSSSYGQQPGPGYGAHYSTPSTSGRGQPMTNAQYASHQPQYAQYDQYGRPITTPNHGPRDAPPRDPYARLAPDPRQDTNPGGYPNTGGPNYVPSSNPSYGNSSGYTYDTGAGGVPRSAPQSGQQEDGENQDTQEPTRQTYSYPSQHRAG